MKKVFLSANELLQDAFSLSNEILKDGFYPDLILGVWRGGAPIAIAAQEYFEYCGHKADHFVVRTSSYHDIGKQHSHVTVDGLEYLLANLKADMSVLILDDVFDSGRSVASLLNKLKLEAKADMPKQIKVGCVWYKPKRNLTEIAPDYFLKTTDDWLVFPHELVGLSKKEIAEGKSEDLAKFLDTKP